MLFQKKCNSTRSWELFGPIPNLKSAKGLPSWHWFTPTLEWNTYSRFVLCMETFKSRLCMQALLWTLHSLKHHSIRRYHQALLVSFSLPYFLSKRSLRAASGIHYTSKKRWKNSSTVSKKGPSLEHVYQTFKTGSCFPGADAVSSSLQNTRFTNSSSMISLASQNRTSEIMVLSIQRLFSLFFWTLLPYKGTSRQFSSEISTRIKWPWRLRQQGWDLLTFQHVGHQGPCVCFRPDVWIWARSTTWHSLCIALWLLGGAWLRVHPTFTGKGQTD